MAFNPDDLTRLRHLVDLADRVNVVTSGHETRIKALEEGGGSSGVLYNTTAYWNEHKTLIPDKSAIIIYSDRAKVDGVDIPGFKVGDGLAYVVDLPFSNADLMATLEAHIADTSIHLSKYDREKLNGSVTASVEALDEDSYKLILE